MAWYSFIFAFTSPCYMCCKHESLQQAGSALRTLCIDLILVLTYQTVQHICRVWFKDSPGIFNKVLLFVADWQLLLASAVGGSAISASVYGLLLYGAYKVCTWKFGHVIALGHNMCHKTVQGRIPRLDDYMSCWIMIKTVWISIPQTVF
jgi:hypothetical protein